MKLILLKNNFLSTLQSLERAIGTTSNLPILKNIYIKTSQGKIFCIATNLDIAIQSVVPGKILEDGEGTVSFSLLYSIIKNIPTERLSLNVAHHRFSITTDNYEASLEGHDTRDFPLIPSLSNKEVFFQIPAVELRDMLQGIIVATQYSEVRPEISGVFFKYEEGHLTLVTTDSFRLAERVLASSTIHSGFETLSMIIPLRTVEEVLRIFSHNEDVRIYIDQNQILFSTGSVELISRLIDGNFPEYKAIIPKQTEHEITLDREECIHAVKLTSVFSGRTNDVVVRVHENGKFVELFSASSALGENRYKIPVKLKGSPFHITFNWKYFLDGLRMYEGKDVVLGVNASDRPATITVPKEKFLT